MPPHTFNIGNISPLIIHTDDFYRIFISYNIVVIHSEFTDDGDIKISFDGPDNVDISAIYNDLLTLSPSYNDISRQFTWVKAGDRIKKYALTAAIDTNSKSVITSIFITSQYCSILINDHNNHVNMSTILINCLNKLTYGAYSINMTSKDIIVFWSRHIRINIEMAEIIADMIKDELWASN